MLLFTTSHPTVMNLICLQTNLKEIFAGETLMFVVLDGGIPVSSWGKSVIMCYFDPTNIH